MSGSVNTDIDPERLSDSPRVAEWGSRGVNSKAAACPIPCGLGLRSPKSNVLLRVLPGSGHLLGPQRLHRTALSPSHLSAEIQRAGAPDTSGTDPSPSLRGDQSPPSASHSCLQSPFTHSPTNAASDKASSLYRAGNPPLPSSARPCAFHI